ncbi:MAG: carbon monoxide dehydrogenase, partial [Armatimonadota bacterium]|nr:carbon monoxide dehydrogenase [Armatimonadota bacterium]
AVVEGEMWLLINRVTDCEKAEHLAKEYAGLKLLGCIPEDPNIQKYELECKSVLDLSDDSKAVVALSQILSRVHL